MLVLLKMKWKFIALKMRWLQIKREHVQDKSGWGLLIRKWCPRNLRDPNVEKHPQFWMEQIGNAVDHHLEVEPPLICHASLVPVQHSSLENPWIMWIFFWTNTLAIPLESPKYEIMWIFLAVPSRVCERWVHTLHQYHSSRPGGSFTRIWNWPNLEYLRKLF